MTLQYQLENHGKPTHFPYKIIRSLNIPEYRKMTLYDLLNEVIPVNIQLNIHEFKELTPKIHTIRQDSNHRWEAGVKAHHKIWTGKPYRSKQYQFIPVENIISTQSIYISVIPNVKTPYTYKNKGKNFQVCIDGRCLTRPEMNQLAINDGFESIDNLLDYFNNNEFSGTIIHLTNFRYQMD